MKKMSLWLIILIPGLFFSGGKQADNKLTDQETGEGWVLLFDGKTPDGWRDYRSEGVTGPWKAEKGSLTSD